MSETRDIVIELENSQLKNNQITDFNNFELPIFEKEALIDYSFFFENVIFENIPCVIKCVSNNWECVNNWLTQDKINVNYLSKHYGKLTAPVSNCGKINFNAHCQNSMTVDEYLDYLRKRDDKVLYLKDWHLRRLLPNDMFYEVPHLFASDWLNEYAIDVQDDDFMFVYIGPKNTWTPLHADVYNSYSWSVNINGSKEWILFPPGEEEKLKDSFGNLPMTFDTTKQNNIKYFEIVQEKNEAIFVPSGWHHQVTNLNDTVSINHNWINACNIRIVWKAMQMSLQSVENEIKEFKDSPDYTSQCQLMLKSLFGMNYTDFFKFLTYIAKKRLNQQKGLKSLVFNKFILGKKHIQFDLIILLDLIKTIDNTLIQNSLYKDFYKSANIEFLDIITLITKRLIN